MKVTIELHKLMHLVQLGQFLSERGGRLIEADDPRLIEAEEKRSEPKEDISGLVRAGIRIEGVPAGEKRRGYRNGKRNKGISSVDLVVRELAAVGAKEERRARPRRWLAISFRDSGFAESSYSAAASRAVQDGLVAVAKNGYVYLTAKGLKHASRPQSKHI